MVQPDHKPRVVATCPSQSLEPISPVLLLSGPLSASASPLWPRPCSRLVPLTQHTIVCDRLPQLELEFRDQVHHRYHTSRMQSCFVSDEQWLFPRPGRQSSQSPC